MEPKTKETELYDKSIALYRDGKYEEAIEGFRTFLKTFPKSDRADNAHFWIGESYKREKKWEEAKAAFQVVEQQYVSSPRVPEAMMQVALCDEQQGRKDQAIATLERIERGGPFPYERDGTVFQNRERRLPSQPRGYYREYTVRTPGARDRGARRIVAGRDGELYYSGDHYRSFMRIRE